jgi:hypothetical protein
VTSILFWSAKKPLWWQTFADDEEVELELQKWLRRQPKSSVLWVLTHW